MERVTLLVERDTSTTIPMTVPDYEVPVLEAIHGSEMVHEVKRESVKAAKIDPQEAFEAMLRRYRGSEEALTQVYAHPGVLAKALDAAAKPAKAD
jgi:hypothetical protein